MLLISQALGYMSPTSLGPTTQAILLPLFYRWGNLGSERGSDSPKATQLIRQSPEKLTSGLKACARGHLPRSLQEKTRPWRRSEHWGPGDMCVTGRVLPSDTPQSPEPSLGLQPTACPLGTQADIYIRIPWRHGKGQSSGWQPVSKEESRT